MKKRILAMLLTICMVVALLPTVALATDQAATVAEVEGKNIVTAELYAQAEENQVTAQLNGAGVAQVNGTSYSSLQAAFNAVSGTGTVTLLDDISDQDTVYISGKTVNLVMGGHTISFKSSDGFYIYGGGGLSVTNGTIKGGEGAFYVRGAATNDGTTTTLSIGQDVTVAGGSYPIWIPHNKGASYGVTVNISGKVSGVQPIYVNGNIQNTTGSPEINIKSTAKITGTGGYPAAYLAGYAVTNIEEGAELSSDTNVIDLAAGELNISGGTFTGKNEVGTSTSEGGAITTTTSTALYIKQHTTGLPITVNISGGTFKAAYALLEETNVTSNDISISVTGGYFHSQYGGAKAVSANSKNTGGSSVLTVTGGYFSSDPSAYCGTDKDGKQLKGLVNDDSTYLFYVGEKKVTAATTTTTAPTTSNEVETATNKKEEEKTLAAETVKAITGTTDSGDGSTSTPTASISGGGLEKATEAVAESNTVTATNTITITVDTKEETLTVAKALETVVNKTKEDPNTANTTVKEDDVKIVVQQYMDITVTDASVSTTKDSNGVATTTKSITLDITPKAKTIATTATGDEEIVVYNAKDPAQTGANAVEVAEETTLEVTGTVEMTIPLPTDFVQREVGDTGNKTVTVKHTKKDSNGKKLATYYYDGTVDKDNVLTFLNPHGFSEFEITTEESPAVAKIGTAGYESLREAIDNAEDGDIITVVKALTDSDASVTTDKTIKLKSGTNTDLKVTVNGEPLTLKADGTLVRVNESNTGSIGGGGSGGGGSSSSSTYALTIAGVQGGKVTASESKVAEGDQVTLTVTPDAGKELDTLTITDESGSKISTTKNADGTYTFTMPGSKVTITATFKDAGEDGEPTHNFRDVDKTKWYNTAVEYVARKGIMEGYGDGQFGPNDHLTRAQLAQILYNVEGSPAVTGKNPFPDVGEGKWYSNAITWAYQAGVVEGYDDGNFGPNDKITREQLATMIWRYAGKLQATTSSLGSFTDAAKVSSYAQDALLWACEKAIVQGDNGVLDPKGNATRAQAATMIMRYLELG